MKFDKSELKKLWKPNGNSHKKDNGQVTIIGGSSLFHGAPMLAIKAASRLVDMTFFGSAERNLELVAKLNSFIWVPWEEIDDYVGKSDSALIGPGMMRGVEQETRAITERLLKKFPDKKWVIDAGSLQTMDANWIPEGAVLTPNSKEFEMLFGNADIKEVARKYKCVIVHKNGAVAQVTDGEMTYEIEGGNAGLTKGGTGDVLAGIIVGLLAKNPPLLAAAAGTYVIKKTADKLATEVGLNYNADDVSENVFRVFAGDLLAVRGR